jgi:hypothetical protein
MAGPRSALGVVGVVTRDGIEGLMRVQGISRRQAEELAARCRRALLRGEEVDPATFPKGTVTTAQNQAAGVPRVEPAEVDTDAETEAQARRIRQLPPSDRQRALVELSAREASMEKSLANGYAEWSGPLAQLRRIRQLVNGAVA